MLYSLYQWCAAPREIGGALWTWNHCRRSGWAPSALTLPSPLTLLVCWRARLLGKIGRRRPRKMLATLPTSPYPPPRGAVGTRSHGLTYERRVGRYLAEQAPTYGFTLHDHPWLPGPCQPDFVLEFASGTCIVVEAKLTQTDCAAQLAKYKRALSPRAVLTLQICRRLTSPATVTSLDELTDADTMLLWV